MKHGDRPLKACIPGGSSVPVLRADECDVNMDFDSLTQAGSALGSAGAIVMDSSTCMVNALLRVAHFYSHESCGQCTPCRDGCGWIERIMERIESGKGEPEDLETLEKTAHGMSGTTICPLADACAMPTLGFLGKFRKEFEEHIEKKGCPYGNAFVPPWEVD